MEDAAKQLELFASTRVNLRRGISDIWHCWCYIMTFDVFKYQ
jgi:hypothetical protein